MKKTLSSIALFLVLIIVAISTIGCSKDSSTDVKQDNQTKSTEEIVSDSSDSIIRITPVSYTHLPSSLMRSVVLIVRSDANAR